MYPWRSGRDGERQDVGTGRGRTAPNTHKSDSVVYSTDDKRITTIVNSWKHKHRNLYLSSPKHGHTTGMLRQGARRGGGAGSGKTVCQENCAHREKSFLALSRASRTRRLTVFPEEQRSDFLCKPMEKQNLRLATSSSPVYQRFITGTGGLLCSWPPTSGTAFFRFCKTFSCRACQGMKTYGGTKAADDRRFVCKSTTRQKVFSFLDAGRQECCPR